MPIFPNQQKATTHRILFAEDHQLTRDLLAVLLRKAGYAVDTAADGCRAFDLFEKSPGEYDVLITDHEMPDLDGLGLVQKLRDAGFRGRIIVVSGSLAPSHAAAYAQFDVEKIYSKPISSERLLDTLHG
jgi:CheY-like chemotaxis protein